MTLRTYLFIGLVVVGCGKSDKDSPAPTATAPGAVPAAAAPPAPAGSAAAPTPDPAVADISACSLLTAAEVGAIFGKTVVSSGSGHSCTYGLDPVEKQKQMEALQQGGMKGVADMAKAGGGFKIPTAISEQLGVEVEVSKDDQTEDQIKAVYAKTGAVVRDATKPEQHGLNDTITAGKDIAGIGDWAFTTNVAAVSMPGVSTRGRLLQAHKGPWLLTVSVTIAPDPGAAKLDDQLGAVARGAIAKLK